MKQQKKQAGITIFYSYAEADLLLYDQLAKHLSQLKNSGLIKGWHGQEILAGADRMLEIDRAIHSAQIILLLISSDFLASDAQYQIEMQQALERHRLKKAHVVPIIVRPCDWQGTPFAHLQCLPHNTRPITSWDDPDEAFSAVARELRKLIEEEYFPLPLLSDMQRKNRACLLKLVRNTWIKGLLEHPLHRAAWIDLHLQERPDVVENPWRVQVQELAQTPRALPISTSIVEVYDEADGKLLILGKPGSGKTTLLLQLTRTLLDRAEADERQSMPVVFNLSSWVQERQPLRTWMLEELCAKYQVPRKFGQDWLDTDQVLPLLDGLDEVAENVRNDCVLAINTYYQSCLEKPGKNPIVVCCRYEEYKKLPTRVMLQYAVDILPLTNKQIYTYLEGVGEQGEALRQALKKDTQLRELARQPLWLSIFTLAYQEATPGEIPTGRTREEVQHVMYATYVERMLNRRGQSKRWKPEQVRHGLAFLAKQMQQHNQSIFLVESLQADWLLQKWWIRYHWCVVLFFGLLFGLLGGLISGVFAGNAFGLSFGLIWGGATGMAFGLLSGLTYGLDVRINPAELFTWSWKKARSGLFFGLFGGLVIVMLFEPIFGLIDRMALGWVYGVLFKFLFDLSSGLFIGLFAGLLSGLSGKQLPEHKTLSPNEGIWRSGKNGLFFGLFAGLFFGLFAGLFFGLFFGLAGGILLQPIIELGVDMLAGLLFGLFFGLFVGVFVGLNAFVKHFILRFFLSRQGDLPWDLVPFLDESVEQLLLLESGRSYMFMHRELLNYFAAFSDKNFS